jgi:hypothetical protein
VFCAAQSYQVWHRRNKAARGSSLPLGWAHLVGRWSARACLLGLLGMALGVGLREVTPIQGILRSDGLLAVRVPDDAEVAFLAEEGPVIQDGVVARFSSPRLDAEVEEALLQVQRFRGEKEILQLQPLAYDPELVRRHQNASTDNRQLLSSLYLLLPTQTGIVREMLQTTLVKQEQIGRLGADLNGYRGELEQARIRRQHAQSQVTRDQALTQRRAISDAEIQDRQRDLRVNEVEEAKLQSRLKDMEAEKQRYEEDVTRLKELAMEQGKLLQSEVERTRREMADTGRGKEGYAAQLSEDEKRASQLRAEEIRQLDARAAEASARLAGLRRRLVVTAPFGGDVVYRAPSPRSARRQELLLVLSPDAGFRLQVRLPAGQAEAMRDAGQLLVEASDARLERRFLGEFRDARNLSNEPGTSVAQLKCQPSPETVQAIADGEKVKVQLLWRPPLLTVPVFQAGTLLALAGALGWGVSRWKLRSEPEAIATPSVPPEIVPVENKTKSNGQAAHGEETPFTPEPATPFGESEVEFGRHGHLLRILGVRLREGIQNGRIDGPLLRTLEWALDRHHVRAVQLLSEGLGNDLEVTERAYQLMDQLDREAADGLHPLAARLGAILHAIGPEVAPPAAYHGR